MDEKKISELVRRAVETREMAYAPYSKFKVGAAVLADNGEVYTGVNVENSSYGLTNCAERTRNNFVQHTLYEVIRVKKEIVKIENEILVLTLFLNIFTTENNIKAITQDLIPIKAEPTISVLKYGSKKSTMKVIMEKDGKITPKDA